MFISSSSISFLAGAAALLLVLLLYCCRCMCCCFLLVLSFSPLFLACFFFFALLTFIYFSFLFSLKILIYTLILQRFNQVNRLASVDFFLFYPFFPFLNWVRDNTCFFVLLYDYVGRCCSNCRSRKGSTRIQ